MRRTNIYMQLPKIPLLLSVAILAVGGIAVATWVNAQSGTTTTNTAPHIISNITVTDITQTSATIRWQTAEPASSYVEYRPQSIPQYGVGVNNYGDHTTVHAVSIGSLNPGTSYRYRVTSSDTAPYSDLADKSRKVVSDSPDQIFTTLSSSTSSVSSSSSTLTASSTPLSSVSSDRIFFICLVLHYGGNAPFWSGSSLPQSPLGAEYAYTPAYQDLSLEAGRSYCAGLYEGLMRTYCSYSNDAGKVEWGIGFYDANRRIYLGGGPGNGLDLIHYCPPSSLSSVAAFSSSSSPLSPRSASASTLSVASLSPSPVSSTVSSLPQTSISPSSASVPTPSITIPAITSTTPSSFPTIPVTGVPSAIYPAPSSTLPRAQTGSITVEKKVSKARVQTLKKQQQVLRRELRSLERSLLRKRNVAALSQIADLRDELADLDLRDPSVAENLRSIQEEIADLRQVVSKKRK